MEKLSEIQMLDKVLEWFASDNQPSKTNPIIRRNINIDDAFKGVVRYYKELDSNEFSEIFPVIMEKLVRDINLFTNEKRIGNSGGTILFSISFEGKQFSKNGGYKQSIIDLESEKKAKNCRSNLLIFGTILAGVGALSLVFWEIYKHYFLHID